MIRSAASAAITEPVDSRRNLPWKHYRTGECTRHRAASRFCGNREHSHPYG